MNLVHKGFRVLMDKLVLLVIVVTQDSKVLRVQLVHQVWQVLQERRETPVKVVLKVKLVLLALKAQWVLLVFKVQLVLLVLRVAEAPRDHLALSDSPDLPDDLDLQVLLETPVNKVLLVKMVWLVHLALVENLV